jgi:hypothetical protein
MFFFVCVKVSLCLPHVQTFQHSPGSVFVLANKHLATSVDFLFDKRVLFSRLPDSINHTEVPTLVEWYSAVRQNASDSVSL